MAKFCPITGKIPSVGHKISHSNIKTKRRFEPNLVSKRIFDPIMKRWVRIRMSTKAIRTLTKYM